MKSGQFTGSTTLVDSLRHSFDRSTRSRLDEPLLLQDSCD